MIDMLYEVCGFCLIGLFVLIVFCLVFGIVL